MICCLIATGLAALPAWSQPELTLEQTGVSVSVTPGGSIALMGTLRSVSNGVSPLSFVGEVLTDDDADGWVSPELGFEVPWRSMWVAVELATGEVALGTPEGYRLRAVGLPEDLHPGAAALAHHADLATMMVVRPGQGAWLQHVNDGGSRDTDGEGNRSVAASLEGFEGLGPNPPGVLHALNPGDVVVMMNPLKMTLSVGMIDPSQGAGQ
jgi:hypothetical protein